MNATTTEVSAKTYISITLAIILLASLGKLFDFPNLPRSTIGFELSLSLAALLLYGFRIIPAIVAGVLVSQLLFNTPVALAFAIAILCVMAAIIGRWGMLNFEQFDNNLENRKSVITLLVWGSGVAALFSTVTSLLMLNSFSDDFQITLNLILHAWMWTAMGVLLIAPRMLLLGNYQYVKLQYDQRQVLWLVAVFASCLAVFTNALVSESFQSLFLPFIFYPLVVWGALYVGLSAVYAGVFLIFMSAYSSYFFGIGYYGQQAAGLAFEMWAFITSLLITGLAVGISQVQREEAEWKAASSRMDDLLSHSALSLNTLLMLQCKTAVNDVKGCYSTIFLMDDSEQLSLDAQFNLPEPLIEPLSSANIIKLANPVTQCFEQGEIISSLENPMNWLNLNEKLQPWGGVHCFPIMDLFRKPLGVLCIFYSSLARFQLADTQRLQRIAYQSSLLIVRKQAELAMQERHREVENERTILRSIIDANPDLVFIEDHERKLTHSNSAFKQIIGLNEEQTPNLTSDDIFSERFAPLVEDMNSKILSGEAELLREEIWLRSINCSAILFDLVKAPVRDIEGHILGIISIGRDITEQRQIEAELVEMTEDQQRTIGQDLHDGVGQKLVGISFLAKMLDQGLQTKQSEFANHSSTLVEQINDVIGEVRGLARGLLPIELESNGLNAALDSLAKNTSKTFNIECLYQPRGEVLVTDRIISLNLYRIVQEAVNNAIKHGKASRVEVSLEIANKNFTLKVSDNGLGFDYHNYQELNKIKGIGLQSILYRSRLINAKVNFTQSFEGGFEVNVVR